MSKKHRGLSREEISKDTGISLGGQLSNILRVLEASDFVECYKPFEDACLKHVKQLKNALNVGGVSSENSAWTLKGTEERKGMQIDLIINRKDRVVNLCEMKFVKDEFSVTNDYEQLLRSRISWVTEHVSRRHNVQMTLVTTFGLKYGIHSGIFQKVVTLDSLFE